jgi:outer membrane protein OmpA-like peptidoglycan-associated protein
MTTQFRFWLVTALVAVANLTITRFDAAFAQDRPNYLPSTTTKDTTRTTQPGAQQTSSTPQTNEIPNPFIRYGIYGQGSYNQHQPNFQDLVPTEFGVKYSPVTSMTGVNGLLFSAGGLLELPIAGPFGISLRAGYSSFGATFRSQGTVPASYDNKPFDLLVGYVAETQLSMIDAQLLLWLRPLRYLSLYVGGTAGYAIQRRVRQYEKSLDPNYTWKLPNGDPIEIRAEFNQDIPNFRTVPLWLTGGISYEIPLNASGTIMLAPEVFYQFQLPSVALFSLLNDPNRTWRVNSLRAGVSLRFSPNPTVYDEAEVKRQQEQQQQQTKPQDVVTTNNKPTSNQPPIVKLYSIVGVATDGSETPNPVIRIEEVLASKSRPILGSIFFSENFATIPDRYQFINPADRSRFKVESLALQSDIDTYYHLLNIIGQRMTTKTKAKLTLTGMADAAGEKNNKTLALSRADEVKKYLVSTWGITASRISTLTRTTFQANREDTHEAEENRRVEITSDTPEILEELRFDYRGKVVTPPVIKARFDIEALAGLQAWKLEIAQDDTPLKTVRGGETYPKTFEWNLANAPLDSLPQTTQEISLRIEATDRNSRTARSPFTSLPVEMVSAAKAKGTRTEIYHIYSSMQGISAFSSADASVQRQLLTIMRKGVKPGAKIAITGYVDARLSTDNAKALTEQQAQNVANQLNMPDIIAAGGGVASFYNNTLPEGRLYNRFVQVEIKSAVK